MLLQRSFGLIIIVAVASTMGVYRINELGPDDESYLQPTSEFAVTVAMISSVRTILKPSLSKSDIKKGTRFLKSIKFFCYMDRPEYHVQHNPKPADETTDVTPDFSFELTNQRQIPKEVWPMFQGRHDEQFAIIIHGWHASFEFGKYYINGKVWMAMVASDLRTFRRRNVIVIDWTYLATWDYFKASKGNVYYMAEIIHDFLRHLMTITVPEGRSYDDFLSRVLLIGHSLGSHIAGRTGSLFNGRIGMIVGLDPAGPLFKPYKADRHCLSPKDARKVYTLHTATSGNGNRFLLGTKDFYVNGGAMQPELKESALSLSHKRVTNIFRASLFAPFIPNNPSPAIGYYCEGHMRICAMDEARPYVFDIDDHNDDILYAPIYLPTTGTQPFFNSHLRMTHVPMYRMERHNGFKSITYKM